MHSNTDLGGIHLQPTVLTVDFSSALCLDGFRRASVSSFSLLAKGLRFSLLATDRSEAEAIDFPPVGTAPDG
jgi:hypothetical protein